MTLSDIIDQLSANTGYPKAAITEILREYHKEVKKGVTRGERVLIRGFGVYSMKEVNARVGYNFVKQEKVLLPATKVPKFKSAEWK